MTAAAGDRPGAVVIGGDYQGLGIVRSLGRRGVPICIIDDERSIARFSRYADYAVTAPGLRDEEATVASVMSAAERFGLDGWVLYPTRDETVAALSRHRAQLRQRFRVPSPPWDVVRHAWDKRRTYKLASKLGIPAPRTWYPVDVSEVRELDAQLPLAIKPAIKEHFIYATKDKAWKAESRADLERLFCQAASILPPGEVMIQELIPGDGRDQFAYCAFFKEKKPVATMVAQRRRQHPAEFGRASTFVQTVEVPELEDLSARFLRAIDYYGLVELEYKRDPRDGQYKLLDVNARTWGYHSLGPAAGVDFPYLLYADQTGSPVQPCRAEPDFRWIRLATDLPTAVVEWARGRLDGRGYLRSLRKFDVESVFTRTDPLPGLVELGLIPYLAVKRGF
jgi:predicted ATP-grasp superfamily ATP-dependent carboligase